MVKSNKKLFEESLEAFAGQLDFWKGLTDTSRGVRTEYEYLSLTALIKIYFAIKKSTDSQNKIAKSLERISDVLEEKSKK